MTILLYAESADEFVEPRLGRKVLEHLARDWPGTFVLAAFRGAPQDLEGIPNGDWIGLPAGGGREDDLARRLLQIAIHRFQVRIILGVGTRVGELLGRLEGAPRIWLQEGTPGPPSSEGGIRCLRAGNAREAVTELEATLVRLLPVEVICDLQDDAQAILARLERYREKGGGREWILHWRGPPSASLRAVAEVLAAEGGSTVRVDFLLNGLLDIPRDWLQPGPVDLLRHPTAFFRISRLFTEAIRARDVARFSIHSDSSRVWVHTGVRVANRILERLSRVPSPARDR